MKKFVLPAMITFFAVAAKAQCDAVPTLNEDFSEFTITTSDAFPQNCWSAIAGAQAGPWIYTDQTDDASNQYVTIYGYTSSNTAAYLVTPELSTIDGSHSLSFTTWKPAFNGEVPAGTITLQVGIMTDPADGATFTAVGDVITVAAEEEIHAPIPFPATEGNGYVAIKFLADTPHNAVAIDDVVWDNAPCGPVADIDENFNGFAQSFDPVNQNCWSAVSEGALLYIDGNEESTENHVTFYTAGTAGSAAYLVSPEVTTMDGSHTLVYDAGLVTPTSVITLQLGTLSDAADTTTFVPFGDEITITGTGTTMPEVTLPSSDTQKYIAFKFTGAGIHDAAFIDNIQWQASAGVPGVTKAIFTIYPNPSPDKRITIQQVNPGKAAVMVYSLAGACVYATTINETVRTIDLAPLAPGMYIVTLKAGNTVTNQKLIIR